MKGVPQGGVLLAKGNQPATVAQQLGVADDGAEAIDHVVADRRREMTELYELLCVIGTL